MHQRRGQAIFHRIALQPGCSCNKRTFNPEVYTSWCLQKGNIFPIIVCFCTFLFKRGWWLIIISLDTLHPKKFHHQYQTSENYCLEHLSPASKIRRHFGYLKICWPHKFRTEWLQLLSPGASTWLNGCTVARSATNNVDRVGVSRQSQLKKFDGFVWQNVFGEFLFWGRGNTTCPQICWKHF